MDMKFIADFIARIDKFVGPTKQISQAMERVTESVEKTSRLKKFGEAVAGAGAAAGAAGVAISLPLMHSVDLADKLTDHLNRLSNAMGNIPDKAKAMADATKFAAAASVKYGVDQSTVLESIYQGVSGFLTSAQAIATADTAMKLSVATQGDAIEATKLLDTMMLNFSNHSLTATQNAKVFGDQLTVWQTQLRNTNLADVIGAMSTAAGSIKAYHVGTTQAESALAALQAAGLEGSEAGVRFEEMIGQIVKARAKLGIALHYSNDGMLDFTDLLGQMQAKFSTPQSQAMMSQILGLRAGPAWALLLGQASTYNEALDKLTHGQNALDNAFSAYNEQGSLVFKQLHEAIKAIEITLVLLCQSP